MTPAGAAFERARALFLEGVSCFESGRFDDAEQRFLGALDAVPGRPSTLVNLAATRLKLARPAEALVDAEQAAALDPQDLDAWFHRGSALAELGRADDARASFERVLAIEPRHAGAWLRHGQALQSLDRHDLALGSYERAVACDPGLAEAWSRRGTLLRETDRLDEAAAAFRAAIAHGADAELHGYYLAAVGAAAHPEAPPGRYVQALFDDYADDYDRHMVPVLQYRGHAVLAAELAALSRPGRWAAALDLGCGTGLCGPLLRPQVDVLVGVDLSQAMLDRATGLGVYDALVHADVAGFLAGTERRFELVVAADVFVYVGDLARVFAGVRRVLEPGGAFAFSVEAAGAGFALLPSLRYGHSEDYLRRLAAEHGFAVASLRRETIREDQRRPVEGLFLVLTRQ